MWDFSVLYNMINKGHRYHTTLFVTHLFPDGDCPMSIYCFCIPETYCILNTTYYTSKDGCVGKGLAVKADDLNSIPGTLVKERTSLHKRSSDLDMYVHVCFYTPKQADAN